MKKLSSSERSYLRRQAHHLEPIVIIGKSGITDGTIDMVNKALEARELIKIKFRNYKEEKKSLSHQIENSTESNLVGIIGHTVILFRKNPNIENQNYTFHSSSK